MQREEIERRIRTIYVEVTETAPMSEQYSQGELRKAYNHGKHMVQVHTQDLMVQRIIELIDEINDRYTSGTA